MSASADQPPEGFERQLSRGGFSNHNGPYFARSIEGGVEQAFFIRERHCNSLGLVHGGMLSAFLDGLLASAASHGGGGTSVTVHLSVDFLSMGRAGKWMIGEARLTRAARDTAFAEGTASIEGRPIARATGVFRLMRRRAT